jgi:hypothetical protein
MYILAYQCMLIYNTKVRYLKAYVQYYFVRLRTFISNGIVVRGCKTECLYSHVTAFYY